MESATSGSVTDTMVRAVEALCLNSYNLKTSQGMRRRLMMLPRPANGSSRSLVLNTAVRYTLSLLKPPLYLGQENSSRTLDSLYFCLTVLYCLDQNEWFWCPVNVAHTCGVCINFSCWRQSMSGTSDQNKNGLAECTKGAFEKLLTSDSGHVCAAFATLFPRAAQLCLVMCF